VWYAAVEHDKVPTTHGVLVKNSRRPGWVLPLRTVRLACILLHTAYWVLSTDRCGQPCAVLRTGY
jgi:hypothetical protein